MIRGRVAVAVRGGRIVSVGRLRIPRSARVVRFRGGTILPGFVDLHVHSAPSSLLRTGVMTVRNLGQPEAALSPPFALPGYPRIFAAGPMITVPGGYPTRRAPAMAAPVRTPAEARAKVDALVRKGASVIKISLETGVDGTLPTLTVEQVRAIVERAHRHRRLVTAHALEGAGVQIALDGGVDELAHMPCSDVTSEQLRELVRRDVAVIGTLRVARLHQATCQGSAANARAFVAAGGRLLYGTDIPFVPAALDTTELGLMQQAGMFPLEVLRAGTSDASRQLGRAHLGRLSRGSTADLWVVRGNPARTLRALRRPLFVMARGRVVRRG